MFFAFIDESGNPDKKDINNQFFVLLALIMHEKGFPFLNDETKVLKTDIWDMVKDDDYCGEIPEDFEVHIKDITNRSNYFANLKDDNEKLIKVLDLIYILISKLYAKIVSVIIPKEDYYKDYSDGMRTWAFKLLIERLNRYVRSRSIHNDEYILMVMDSAGQEEDHQRLKEVEQYMLYGTNWEEYPEQVIETPFIGDSKIHNGVQLADAIAFMLRRHTRKNFGVSPDSFFNKFTDVYMKQIVELFRLNSKWIHEDMIKFFPNSVNVPYGFWNIFKRTIV